MTEIISTLGNMTYRGPLVRTEEPQEPTSNNDIMIIFCSNRGFVANYICYKWVLGDESPNACNITWGVN